MEFRRRKLARRDCFELWLLWLPLLLCSIPSIQDYIQTLQYLPHASEVAVEMGVQQGAVEVGVMMAWFTAAALIGAVISFLFEMDSLPQALKWLLLSALTAGTLVELVNVSLSVPSYLAEPPNSLPEWVHLPFAFLVLAVLLLALRRVRTSLRSE
jgi:hypothetical protein